MASEKGTKQRYVDVFRASLWYDVTMQTVCRWCRQGLFPNAIRVSCQHHPWRIPESALEGFEPPRRGGDMRSARATARAASVEAEGKAGARAARG